MDILEMWGLPFDEHLRGRGASKTEEFNQKFLNLPEKEKEFLKKSGESVLSAIEEDAK